MTIKRTLSRVLLRTRNFILGTGSRKEIKVRNSVGMGFAVTAAALALVVANPIVPAATAGTIRSGSGADSCTVDVGNTANASVTKNGNYCLVWVTNSTTVSVPNYVSSVGIIVVGGGAGGFADGGSGGSGGEVRYNSAQTVTAGSTATINVGAGGAGGSWSASTAPGTGGATTVSGAGMSYTANGGNIGSGWGNSVGPSGGSGGSGGTGAAGGAAGGGPGGQCTPYNLGTAGSGGPTVSIGGLTNYQFSGGGGGGIGANTYNSASYYGLGPAGGGGGGGRGANLRYAVDGSTWRDGASAGQDGFYFGAGGGGGAACDAYASGQNGTYQRTAGGSGYKGVVVMSWLANKLTLTQAPDGCLSNVTEACLTSAKVQVQDPNGANLSTSGLTVSIVSTTAGTLGGTTSVTTDASGVATFNNFWITGSTVGTSVTITFETPGYRNTQATFTLRGYAESLTVVSGSTDTTGFFYGTTGVWLATSTNSNISVTTLANELANRDVTLRAASPTLGNGTVTWSNNAVMTEGAAATRTLNIQASNSFQMTSGGRMTSTGQPLNVIINTNMDATNGGMIHIDGSASAYAIETNGGHVALGGGGTSSTTSWNGLTIPSGAATGYAAASGGTGSWWGVELGVNTDIANQKLIKTSGGSFRANGLAYGINNISTIYGVAWESGTIDTGAGSIAVYGNTSGAPNPATNDNWGIGLGANRGNSNDVAKIVTTGTVLLNGAFGTAGTSNAWGVNLSYADIDAGSSTITVNGANASYIGAGNTFRSPLVVSPTSAGVTVGGA
ncbi:MAG: beta strand repeat-containing protein, partial [Micrococcales bacterium]